ncbi:MAG: Adenine deaminase [Syntrophorhabdaceae bacterium PtaU1.Bin034]|nr:MAG: Adenine deaminase [Syntrophorhabdaceae bacterium PtaU1.Bin034]
MTKVTADLLITNGLLVDPARETVERTDLAIKDGKILSFSPKDADEVFDARGSYISCGFIESHLHLEGLHLLPEYYFRAFLAHGTTTVITDLHEIANAGGMKGIEWYLSLTDRIPLDIFVMAPSCVPSSRFELGAGELGPEELSRLRNRRSVIGLGEVMDLEGVITRRKDVMEKIKVFEGRPIDGHAPGLVGDGLDLYMSAGIFSDHETTGLEEGEEKLRRGMHLFLREGTVSKDLKQLLPLVRPRNLSSLSLCTDDLSARDLFETGHLDRLVSRLVTSGVSPVDALKLVTRNPASYFNLNDRNALAVGKKADLVIFDRPETMRVSATLKEGRIVFREGDDIFENGNGSKSRTQKAMNVAPFSIEDLRQKARGGKVRVIGVRESTILMEDLTRHARIENGYLVADHEQDIVFAYVFDRYRAERTYGFGFVNGFSLKDGALGTTYAHDSHNLIVVGDNIEDIHEVLQILRKCGGGMAAVCKGAKAFLPMSYFGIISPLDARSFLEREAELQALVLKMGVRLKNPFFQMSFISLPVIPHLRLTTKGLFHVVTARHVSANHD